MKASSVVLLVLLLIIAVIAGGCTRRGVGSFTLSIDNPEMVSANGFGISRVEVVARNGGVVLNASIDSASSQISCDFQSVLTGIWTVEANGIDSNGKAIFYGKTTVIVEKGANAKANLKLQPVNGEYEMQIDLSGVDVSKVVSAEIWVYPFGVGSYTKKHVITSEINKVHTVTAAGIKPQTYEFQIRLFGSSGASYYTTPWYTFDVLPAYKTSVSAGLEMSSFSVGILLEDMPGKPVISSVTASEATGKLKIVMSWSQPGAGDLKSAEVFVRFYETERYDLAYTYIPEIMQETVSEVTFSIDSDDFLSSGKTWLKVVTVGKNSMKSLSSEHFLYP